MKLVVFVLGAFVLALITASDYPVIKTRFGVVKGTFLHSEPNNRKFSAFMGIPYALPPTGDLRFQPPVETENFYKPHEPLDAAKYKNDCAQLEFKTLNFKGSEDCLHLNVFTPDVKFLGNTNLPVMVWIHGGGFLTGSSDPSFYGPERFLDHNIVLVTINYRLGALGFLTNGAESNPANIGLMDQIMAIKWVKNNIESFGGDPDRVTIFGESTGGSSVMALLASPRATGLFSKAIAMSGSYGTNNIFLHNSRKIPHYTSILAAELNCDVTKTSEDTINCLRRLPAEEILRKASLFVHYNVINNPFKPTPDPGAIEPVLPHPLDDLWKKDTPFDVPLLIGGNKDEGIISFVDFLSDESLYKNVEESFYIEGPVLLLNTDADVAEREESESATAQSIKKRYLRGNNFTKEARSEILQMLTDVHYLSQIDKTVKELIPVKTTPTYYYNYQHQGSFSLPMALGHMEPLGVCHMDEVFLMFRHDEVSRSWLGDLALQTEEDIQVSSKLLELWTTFATTGTPASDKVWPPADDVTKPKYAVIDHKEIRMKYPEDFSDRMTFVQNMMNLIYNHRNFNMADHPMLKQMELDRQKFAEEEIQYEADWGIKVERDEEQYQDLETEMEKEFPDEIPDGDIRDGGDELPYGAEERGVEDDLKYFVEEGNIAAAMKLLTDLEEEASQEVKKIIEHEKMKKMGMVKDEL